MGCRGICTRLRMRRPASGSVYGERCRCNACGVWMPASVSYTEGPAARRCPCCRQRLRFARRGASGSRRGLPATNAGPEPAGVPAPEPMPKIPIRPFYAERRCNPPDMAGGRTNDERIENVGGGAVEPDRAGGLVLAGS
ncbi:MAG: hypothetical protein OXK17_00780 [Thaumarchaeota archaeon]|nr:hypothetical protein [Nitrososphaerota archaeon]